MVNESTKKGVKVRNSFTSPFEELEKIRKGVYSQIVLTAEEGTYSEAEITKAEEYEQEFIEYNKKVEDLL